MHYQLSHYDRILTTYNWTHKYVSIILISFRRLKNIEMKSTIRTAVYCLLDHTRMKIFYKNVNYTQSERN